MPAFNAVAEFRSWCTDDSEEKAVWEKLDTVPWCDLEHAYGQASDVPELLRAVLDRSSRKRHQAYQKLGASICHQGSSYSASLHAIPFLLELAQNQSLLDRHRAISLVRGIAIGLDSDMLLTGSNIGEVVSKMEGSVQAMDEEKRIRSAGWGPVLGLACYERVRKAVSRLIDLLFDEDEKVANEAGCTLAWFPSKSSLSLPRIRNVLKDSASENQLANFMLFTGLLEWFSGSKRTSVRFVQPHLDASEPLVRYAAAIYMSWHGATKDSTKMLQELSSNGDYEYVPELTVFCDGYLATYALFLQKQ